MTKTEEDESEEIITSTTLNDKAQTQFESQAFVSQLNHRLLTWYDANHRTLPWRKTPETSKSKEGNMNDVETGGGDDKEKNCEQSTKEEQQPQHVTLHDLNQRAYQVWISEIMSQQTRIATVLSYYDNWMKQFPTVQHLARATVNEVHAVWSGLGYYRRVDNIHKAAQKVVNDLGGKFPTSVSGLLELPGIGRYTAGAIASIVFHERAPIVDGNVLRLFSRLLTIPHDISKQKHCNDHFWPLAQQLVSDPSVPTHRIGDLNQSLMEMGATVCTPKGPSCSTCCIRDLCLANKSVQSGDSVSVEIWPVKAKKKQKATKFIAVCILYGTATVGTDENEDNSESGENDDGATTSSITNPDDHHYYYIVKNPSSGLLANLYQFPSITIEETTDDDTIEQSMRKYVRNHTDLELSEDTGDMQQFEYCGQVQHIFTHIDMHLKVFCTRLSHDTIIKNRNRAHCKTRKQKQHKNNNDSDNENDDENEKHDDKTAGIESALVTQSGFDDYGIPTVVRKVFQCFLDREDTTDRRSGKQRSTKSNSAQTTKAKAKAKTKTKAAPATTARRNKQQQQKKKKSTLVVSRKRSRTEEREDRKSVV